MDIDIELVNLRVRVIEESTQFSVPGWEHTADLDEQFTTMLGIDERVPVINRAGLKTGQTIKGPSLITETSTTTWLAEGWTATVDKVCSLALCRE